MALYNRQKINSPAALRREKLRLRAELKQLSATGFFAPEDSDDEHSNQEHAGTGWWGLLSGLLTSRTTLDSLLAVGVPLLRFFPQDTQKNFLRTFVREFFGGYVKWKGVSWGFRLIRSLLRKEK